MISVVDRLFRVIPAVGDEVGFDALGNVTDTDPDMLVPIVRVDKGDFDTVTRNLDCMALGLLAGAGGVYKDTEGGDGILTADFVARLTRGLDMNLLYFLSEDTPIQSALALNDRLHVVDRAVFRNAAEVLRGRLPEELRPCNAVIGVRLPSRYFVRPVREEGDDYIECGLGVLKPGHVVVGVF